MNPPGLDLENRRVVWDAMHLLWLDTDVNEFYLNEVAKTCAKTDYTLSELELIHWGEVYPYMRWNLWDVAGDWQPLDSDVLTTEIMKRHRFGKKLRFQRYRKHATEIWETLASKIVSERT